MTEAAIANLDDERLIRDGEAAVDLYNRDLQNARARIMPMALGLLAAKRKYPATQDFGDWLQTSSYREIGPEDRAALINIGKEEKLCSELIKSTSLTSPRLFWEWARECKTALSVENIKNEAGVSSLYDTKSTEHLHQSAKTQETSTESRPVEQSAVSEKPPQHLQLKKGHRLSGWPRAEEIISLYQHSKTRGTISRLADLHNGKQVWKLMAQALDAGLLRSNNIVIEAITARLLFPHDISGRSARFLHTYDLTKPAGRKAFEADLLPRMIANKDALLAAPDDIEDILNRARRQQQSEQKEAIVAERVNKALAALPSDESEVIMFGKRMWPIVEGETIGAYDFRTLQVAVWKFTDLNRWMHRDSPLTRAINIRNSTKWDRHFIGELLKDSADLRFKIDRIYQLVHAITQLMTENPDGECKEPLTPLVLG
jgi:hypothetical protein